MISFKDFLNWLINRTTVKITAMISAAGSAIYTAMVGLEVKILGIIKINGIRRINFLVMATAMDAFAFPKAAKVSWQAIWTPKINRQAR